MCLNIFKDCAMPLPVKLHRLWYFLFSGHLQRISFPFLKVKTNIAGIFQKGGASEWHWLIRFPLNKYNSLFFHLKERLECSARLEFKFFSVLLCFWKLFMCV